MPAGQCDTGLECKAPNTALSAVLAGGVCVPKKSTGAERSVQTKCQQKRRHMLMIMVVWKGMWVAQCDNDGAFVPEQCDNDNHCFCVDTQGEILNGTKVKGHTSC
ncbi:hypothetical protein ScPMuIL_008393 [Solemya velum]